MSKKKRLIPAVGYLRMSTDDQEGSIERQRDEIEAYKKKQGYKIIRWYKDPGITGDSVEERPDFCQMLEDSKVGDFEAILLWKQNRFGRFTPLQASHLLYPLNERGQYLVTVDRGVLDINNTATYLMFVLEQHGSKEYLLSLSSDVCSGMKTSRKNAGWIGSAPYGYEIEGDKHHKKLVLADPSKVEVIRRIFREYIENGGNLSHVANSLNADGIPTPRDAKHWRFDSVKSILENQAYCGDYVGGKQANGKYNTVKGDEIVKSNGRLWNDKEDWIIVKDTHEAIIDRKTFAQAQRLLEKNKTGKPPKTDQYLFHGLLECGRCGAKIWGDRCDRGGVWYECSNRKQNSTDACKGTKVPEHELLSGIAGFLEDQFGPFTKVSDGVAEWKESPEGLEAARKLVTPPKRPKRNVDRLKKQRDRLEAEIAKMKRQMREGRIDDEFLRNHQDGINEKKSQVSKIEAELNVVDPTEKEIDDDARQLYWDLLRLQLSFQVLSRPELLNEFKAGNESILTSEGGQDMASIRRALGHVDRISIDTTIRGSKTRTRHQLVGGEIAVGSTTGNLNPHHRG